MEPALAAPTEATPLPSVPSEPSEVSVELVVVEPDPVESVVEPVVVELEVALEAERQELSSEAATVI